MVPTRFLLEKALPMGRRLLAVALLLLFFWLWDPVNDWRAQLTMAIILGILAAAALFIASLFVISWSRIPDARRGSIFLYCVVTVTVAAAAAWAGTSVNRNANLSPMERKPVWVLER